MHLMTDLAGLGNASSNQPVDYSGDTLQGKLESLTFMSLAMYVINHIYCFQPSIHFKKKMRIEIHHRMKVIETID
jgi:hypothetical protein